MGRGRAKAKQTKVARDLKYRPINTDFASLERELRGHSSEGEDLYEQIPDQYADLVDQSDDEDEDEDEDIDEGGRR